MGDFLLLKTEGTTEWARDDEPSRFVYEVAGKLVILDVDNEHRVGSFAAAVIDVEGVFIERESIFDVFDTSAKWIDYYSALYDDSQGDFKKSGADLACGEDGYLWRPSLLILDRLIINPQYRGKGYGLLAIRALMHRYRLGCGLIAMKPFPLQFEAGMRREDNAAQRRRRLALDSFAQDEKKATQRLRRYYARLGFKAVPRTPYMVRCAEDPLPDVKSLTPGKSPVAMPDKVAS